MTMPLRFFLAGLLLLTALGLGLVGYQAVQRPRTATVAAVPAAPPAPQTVDLLAAARGLPAGTLMRDEDFARRAVPTGNVPEDAVKDTPEQRAELRGALLRRYLEAGSTLMQGDILHPRDRGFLAAVLAPGARAISLGVDAVTGNGGLIWPGDRVDVILTQQLDLKDAPPAKRFVGEIVLSDVRVVAVDQSIAQGAVASGDNTTGRVARTVTLEVSPQQAERAAVADRLGKITLAIRAVDATTDVAAHGIYSGDVSPALADGAPQSSRMRVIEGKDARDVTFE
ncbi:MAG TPA: Flp pilus assembly protein CpaB [Acetobacteraceae bacterium]|jgi:pilus assembly protein CpaB